MTESQPVRRSGAWILRHKGGACVTSIADDRVLYGDETSAVIFPTKKAAQEIKRGRPDLTIERALAAESFQTEREDRWMRNG